MWYFSCPLYRDLKTIPECEESTKPSLFPVPVVRIQFTLQFTLFILEKFCKAWCTLFIHHIIRTTQDIGMRPLIQA